MTETTAAEYLIRNCTIAYKCKTKWEELQDDGIPSVRFCDECKKEVHLCVSDKDLAEALLDNLCVAIKVMPAKLGGTFIGIIRPNPEQ